jgi:hypothetical protein
MRARPVTQRSSKPALLWLERQNHMKDESLMARLEMALRSSFEVFIPYRCNGAHASTILDPTNRLKSWPVWVRKPIKALLLIGHPSQWSHFLNWWYVSKTTVIKPNALNERTRDLRHYLKDLKSRHQRLVIIGRSINAVTATRIADEFDIEKVIALGYAFENPKLGVEPIRFKHLETIRTPCLIVQGVHDVYGGNDVAERYRFSPAVKLAFANTDHDFHLEGDDWNSLIHRLNTFIGEPLDTHNAGGFVPGPPGHAVS